jgi:hypothetical protein
MSVLIGEAFIILTSVVAHVVGLEVAASKIKPLLRRRLLANHDLLRAFRDSYLAAVNLLENQHQRQRPLNEDRKATARAFRKLRAGVEDYFPLEAPEHPLKTGELASLTSEREAVARLVATISLGIPEAPPSVRELVDRSFADAFLYAFHELGIKHNEAVRSVLVHELLRRTHDQASELHGAHRAILHRLDAILSEKTAAFEADASFKAVIAQDLACIRRSIAELESLKEEMSRRLHPPAEGAVAWLVVYRRDDTPILSLRVAPGTLRVGRAAESDLLLPDRTVSAKHATLEVRASDAIVRDCGSRNGTWVMGHRVEEHRLEFGTPVSIGTFVIRLETLDPGQRSSQRSSTVWTELEGALADADSPRPV